MQPSPLDDFAIWLQKERNYTPRAVREAVAQVRSARRGYPTDKKRFREAQTRKYALEAYAEWEAALPPGHGDVPEALKAYHAWEGGGERATRRAHAVARLLAEADPETVATSQGRETRDTWASFMEWVADPDRPKRMGRPRKEDDATGMLEWLMGLGLKHNTATVVVSRTRGLLRSAAIRGCSLEQVVEAGLNGDDASAVLARFRAFERGDKELPERRRPGRAPIEDGLDAFAAWLPTQNLGESTIQAIRVALRWVLREMESTGKSGREVTFPMETSTHKQRRYAWYRYVDYANATEDPAAVAARDAARTAW